jgi:hypothetical protein
MSITDKEIKALAHRLTMREVMRRRAKGIMSERRPKKDDSLPARRGGGCRVIVYEVCECGQTVERTRMEYHRGKQPHQLRMILHQSPEEYRLLSRKLKSQQDEKGVKPI